MKLVLFLMSIISIVNEVSLINPNEIKLIDKHRIKLSEWLITHFKSNLINIKNIDSVHELKQFQEHILKSRNAECLINKYGDLDRYPDELNQLQNKNTLNQFINALKNTSNSFDLIDLNLVNKFNQMCLDSTHLIDLFKLESFNLSFTNTLIAQVMLTQLSNTGCNFCLNDTDLLTSTAIDKSKTWFGGLIAVSLITITSFTGAFLRPITKYKHYNKILMFLISLAIGTLLGTGILHLIPQAYGITEDLRYATNHAYLGKSIVILAGLYFFFLVEQIMRTLMQFKKKFNVNGLNNVEESLLNLRLDKKIQTSIHDLVEAHMHGHSHEAIIAPVAWIIIAGEGLHNFIDGLSIGAAFTETLLKGISLSIAIICEEFPHKLGDFAILLAAGMPFKMALLCNFISSCFIYLGLVIGIVLGESVQANQWIYATAGGMFLYIAVCDMFPELVEMGTEIEKEENKNKESFPFKLKITIFLIQNLGVLIGISLMLILAAYSKNIQL